MDPKTRASQATKSKDLVIEEERIVPFLTDLPMWQTDGQTNGRTDRIAMANTCYSMPLYTLSRTKVGKWRKR